MKEQFVSDLKEGDKVLSFFLVKHKQLKYFRDRTKGQFLTLALSDKTGQVLARVWELTLYPQINRDLLMTGALLHDVGKTKEFTYQRDIEYSDEGRLLGHVVLSERMITDRRDKTKPWTEYDTLLKRYLYAGGEEEELVIEEAGPLE